MLIHEFSTQTDNEIPVNTVLRLPGPVTNNPLHLCSKFFVYGLLSFLEGFVLNPLDQPEEGEFGIGCFV